MNDNAEPKDDLNFEEPSPSIDKEQTRRNMAIGFAQEEKAIFDFMREKFPNGFDVYENEKIDFYIDKNDSPYEIINIKDAIKKPRVDFMTLKHQLDRSNMTVEMQKFTTKLGVDTDNLLILGVHTEIETQEEFRDITRKSPSGHSKLMSLYLFDENGNYAKMVTYPPYPERNREDLMDGFRGSRYYKSEMKPGDFELVDQALITVKNMLGIPIKP